MQPRSATPWPYLGPLGIRHKSDLKMVATDAGLGGMSERLSCELRQTATSARIGAA